MIRLTPVLVAAVVAAFLAACAAAPAPSDVPSAIAPAASKGTVEARSFRAPSLGVDKRYLVYLPAGYAVGTTRYPVVYLLHGLGGGEEDWTRSGKAAEAADALGFQGILVMPDGDDSFYANWVSPADRATCLATPRPFGEGEQANRAADCVERADYESYIVKDLVADVDATYRTIAGPKARGVSGVSMGGFGALHAAMRHPDVFSSVASHSGLAALMYMGPHPYEKGKAMPYSQFPGGGPSPSPSPAPAGSPPPPARAFPAPPADPSRAHYLAHLAMIFGPPGPGWFQHDPVMLARRLEPGQLAVYLDCGTEDQFRFQDGVQLLRDVLVERGLEPQFALVPGGHDYALWKVRLRESLAFHARHLTAPSPTP